MTNLARGSFDVALTPQAQDAAEGTALARLSLDKQFHGELQATSKGEMLSARTEDGYATYVAIERATGTLHGRSGSFVLVHQGLMTPDVQQLTISVMPGSGTGELAGLSGSMTINIADGQHSYELTYTLGE